MASNTVRITMGDLDDPAGCVTADFRTPMEAEVYLLNFLDPVDLQTLKSTEIERVQRALRATARVVAVPVHPAA